MFKRIFLLMCLLLSGWVHAFTPQSGTWIVTSELNGQPGRGLAMDVQDDVLVMQMYAYEKNGQPTFYMATGKLVNNQVTTKLGRYSGGRYLGSEPRSGVEDGSPGNVTIRFTSGVTGFIKLPSEGEVAIKRFDFSSRLPESLLGGWVYALQLSNGVQQTDLRQFNKINPPAVSGGTGFVLDSRGEIGCEYISTDFDNYNMYCVTREWLVKIRMSGNEGEGNIFDSTGVNRIGIMYIHKLQDAQGKYLGLLN
jgi:hypothetical protein